MSRSLGSASSGDVARGAGFAAAKGLLLIGLAVVIGIVLLQQVDDDNARRIGATPAATTPPKKATTTVPPPPPTTAATPTTPQTPATPPDQLRVIVLNGGAPSGEAARLSDRLKGQGYTNQPQDANNWSGRSQQGNTVLCKPPFPREALLLAGLVGQGTQVEPYPADPPSVIENEAEVDCIIAVGS
jgi:LytR cell envelope-related transcriptional attenuator